MLTVTPELSTKLDDSVTQIEAILSAFFAQTDAMTLLIDAFGDQIDPNAVQQIADLLDSGSLSSVVPLEVVPGEILGGGTAAYVADANTVYLAEEFLANALPDELVATLLQQVGYMIDDFVNESDAAGSEGAIFEAIVTGRALSPEQLAELKADTKSVQELTIEDAVVSAEMSLISPHLMHEGDMNGSEGMKGGDGMAGSEGTDGDAPGRSPMQGGKGRDRFRGDAEADDMSGGGGRDRLRGEGGDDKIDGGGGRDRLDGGEGADELTGGGGRDVIKGGLGDDLINGGGGRDRLKGGEGMDTFDYDGMKDKGDLILDFDATADVLDLSGVLSELGYENSTFDQLINDVIVLGQSKRGTRVAIDADGLTGEARPKAFAALKGVNADDLSASNFILQEVIN